jgi:DNA-binding transcriptional ArsR family regulator
MAYESTLTALANPTRRTLFERLRHAPRTVGELACYTGISQPGVSQHLRVLREARLVTVERQGTRHYYRADRKGLEPLRRWVESYWDDVLGAYAAAASAPARKGSRR